MTKPVVKIQTPSVPPLQMKKPDGSLYQRPEEVEASLVELYGVTRDDVAQRSTLTDKNDSCFIRSECVLHFVRQNRCGHSPEAFGLLFQSLRQRLLRGLWVPMERLPGETEEEKVSFHKDVRDFALDHFLSMMCSDKAGYDTRLDHFECRFNQCLRADRVDATRKVLRRPKLQSMPDAEADSVVSEFGPEFVSIFQNKTPNSEGIAYRNEIVAAINAMQKDEKQVLQLVAMGYSNVEIARLVNCSDKTVYNRRKRAEAKIAEFVDLGDRK
ncbi:Sigma-70, region 4 [Rubripirellula tenax]|uniref:Sigma-70, region 4 n=1 Tax=Rubripirellula tenax TaxID=2528015 RepID=A0A5C6FE22_9BACT|nr:sigma factor-like helix-turn-helix DNA-binding protein [Rubripirellula tenax]TWU58947.1 Sigma-70, region 4 [Rubripirellula tenax]